MDFNWFAKIKNSTSKMWYNWLYYRHITNIYIFYGFLIWQYAPTFSLSSTSASPLKYLRYNLPKEGDEYKITHLNIKFDLFNKKNKKNQFSGSFCCDILNSLIWQLLAMALETATTYNGIFFASKNILKITVSFHGVLRI